MYVRVRDVYGLMGILPVPDPENGEASNALFLAVIVDCKSIGKIDVAEIFSVSVAGCSKT